MAQHRNELDSISRVIERHGGKGLWTRIEQITIKAKTGGVALPYNAVNVRPAGDPVKRVAALAGKKRGLAQTAGHLPA